MQVAKIYDSDIYSTFIFTGQGLYHPIILIIVCILTYLVIQTYWWCAVYHALYAIMPFYVLDYHKQYSLIPVTVFTKLYAIY